MDPRKENTTAVTGVTFRPNRVKFKKLAKQQP